jgi:regulator of protease activity HflC (stomatin/prohibitin superfamily)
VSILREGNFKGLLMKKRIHEISMGVLLIIFGFSCATVPAGSVGIKVYLYGGDKGVDSQVLGVGRYYIGINEQLFIYETFAKTYPFTQAVTVGSPSDEAFYFQSNEGIKCNVDVSVQSKADPTKVSILFQTYREQLPEIIKTFMRNDMRNAFIRYASDMKLEDLYSSKKGDLIKKVEKDVRDIYASKGIIVDNVSFLSDIRFPIEIQNSITAKIEATQKAIQRENELREAEAMAKKRIIEAGAEAESNRIKIRSLTPQLLEYERVMNERDAIHKWNGATPQYTNGNIIPFTSVK